MDPYEFDRQTYVAKKNLELGIITRNQYLEIYQYAIRRREEDRNRTFPMSERQELTKAIMASRREPVVLPYAGPSVSAGEGFYSTGRHKFCEHWYCDPEFNCQQNNSGGLVPLAEYQAKHPEFNPEYQAKFKEAELYFEVTGRGTTNGTLDHYSKWDYSDWREEYLATGQSYAFDKMMELYDGSELPKPVTKTVNPFDEVWHALKVPPALPVVVLVILGFIALLFIAAL